MYTISVLDAEPYRHVVQDRPTGRAWACTMSMKFDEFHAENNQWYKARVWYVDTLATADEVAKKIAEKHPGCEIIISKMEKAWGSGIAPVIEKKVSEKGILPA